MMSVQTLRESLHKLIDQIQDAELLAAYYKILSGKQADWWEQLGEAEKAQISQGIRELDAGESVSHEEVMKEVRNLLNITE